MLDFKKIKKSKAYNTKPKNGVSIQSQQCHGIVGIGASAGGFAAIKTFLESMPTDSGIAFVIVQHFDAAYKSQSAELFGRHTTMPVSEALDGETVQENHVYTIPSDRDVTIETDRLRLHTIEKNRDKHPSLHLPIDRFLQSLAQDQNERAIAIIFSGTGCDGTQGIKAIEQSGGLVLAQQPESAQYDGMPRSAIASGLVDRVLPPEQMPKVLIDYVQRCQHLLRADGESDATTIAPTTLEAIFALIQQRRGIDFSCYKRNMLLRRIHRRMALLGVDSTDAYLTTLNAQPDEIDALCKDLLIGVSDFFRDADAWQQLTTKAIEPLVARTPTGETIRAWVAGTSTGEEAYSLVILLLEAIKKSGKHCTVNVFATDTNADALTIARAGVYPLSIAAQIAPDYLHRYFTLREDQKYQVAPSLREAVIFGKHNLVTDPPYSRVDMLTCRNLLIYLEPEAQKRIILLAHFALRADGYLFLGNAETIGQRDEIFKPLSKKWRIYQRVGATPYKQLDIRFAAVSTQHGVAGESIRRSPTATSAEKIAQRLILDYFAPASVLVNNKYAVMHYSGPTERFLTQPTGAPTQDLLLLARQGLRAHLRKALRQAAREGVRVEVSDARVKRGNTFVAVKLTVLPIAGANADETLQLIVFEDIPTPAPTETIQSLSNHDSTWIQQLEDELHTTKDDLQSTIEHLENANEELKISNEEVVSINEEMQSVNEELSTVNQQLQSKIAELKIANNDLTNLIASSDIAVLCLDRSFRIKWFTPPLRTIFNVETTDMGRPISDFSSSLSGPSLINEAKQVVNTLTPLQTELKSQQGHWYLRRLLPYRIDHDSVEGVIVTFIDITENKLAAEHAIAEREQLLKSLERMVEDRTARLRALAFELTKSEEMERRAIALDLHDGLGQNLALAKIKLDSLKAAQKTKAARDTLSTIEKLIDQSNNSLRSLAAQLCPPMLYDIGLVAALQWLADEMYRDYGLHVHVSEDAQPKPLEQSVRVILFRAVRELLINVTKHADVPTVTVEVSVTITSDSERKTYQLKIIVRDNGKGFDPKLVSTSSRKGFGLLSVCERLGHIGGNAEIISAPNQGTQVILTVPISLEEM